MPTDPPSLPHDVRVLWRLREPSRRGPRPTLSVDEVVDAAIEIADRDGLTAVSMGGVAARLGRSTMALYRHVASKDDLLLLMSDVAVGAPPPIPARLGWRRGVERWASAVRDVWLARPWLLEIPVTGPPVGPNNLAWMDACLQVLRRAGIDEEECIAAALLVSTYVRGEAVLGLQLRAAAMEDPAAAEPPYAAMVELIDPATYPALHSMVVGGVFEGDEAPDADYRFALTVILDGIAARLGLQAE